MADSQWLTVIMVDGLRVVTSVMGSKNRRWACPLTQGILALQHKGVLRELEKQERLGGVGVGQTVHRDRESRTRRQGWAMGMWLTQGEWDLFWTKEHWTIKPLSLYCIWYCSRQEHCTGKSLHLGMTLKVLWVINNNYKRAGKRSHKTGLKSHRWDSALTNVW